MLLIRKFVYLIEMFLFFQIGDFYIRIHAMGFSHKKGLGVVYNAYTSTFEPLWIAVSLAIIPHFHMFIALQETKDSTATLNI